MYKVAVLPGDGIGPEVVNEALKCLKVLNSNYGLQLDFKEMDINAERYLRTGELLTDHDIEELRKFDTIFLGAIGDDRVQPGVLEKGILLKARFTFDQYVNHRPAQMWRPFGRIKRDVEFKLDVYRENTEDFYIGAGGRVRGGKGEDHIEIKRELYNFRMDVNSYSSNADDFAYEIGIMSKKNIERFADYVITQARMFGEKKITVVDKANVLSNIYHMWREVWNQKCKEANMEVGYMFVDAMAMALVKNPDKFRIIATPNMFGDILTDLSSEVCGGLGLAPGGNINPNGLSMYEPVHGSAPKYKGMNTINPTATILAAKLMVDNMGRRDLGQKIEDAVRKTFDKGIYTQDLGGKAKTSEFGDHVAAELRKL
jgi:3-isopropylmalate dehydrogenase